MKYEILFKSENSDFVKIAFFTIVGEYNKLVIVSTKENLTTDQMGEIANCLIDNEIVKDEFSVFNIYIKDKQVELYNKLK